MRYLIDAQQYNYVPPAPMNVMNGSTKASIIGSPMAKANQNHGGGIMPVDRDNRERHRKPAIKPKDSPMEPVVKAEHTVAEGETLSDLALKYYGSAVEEKWMAIYKANKAVIGDNPNIIKPGQVLKIPEL
jgi:nucleoid-associated protein YgaU